MEDFYDQQKNDFEVVQGDTLNIIFSIYDQDKARIDLTGGYSEYWIPYFTLRDPETFEIVTNPVVTYNDTISGAGIHLEGDGNIPGNIILDYTNEIAIQYTAEKTALLDPGTYPFDLKFVIPGLLDDYTTVTAIQGNIIVVRPND